MLKLLRKKGVMKKMLWVVAVIIIISFGFFGRANYLSKRTEKSYAGIVFGKKISFSEFRTHILHARNQAILTYGNKFFEIQDFLNLPAEAWDRIILLHEAHRRRIKISDKEVRETINNFEFFKTDSNFDLGLYQKTLRYVFGCEDRIFEEGIRNFLIFAKLREEETSFVTISENQILDEYKKKNEKVRVSYVMLLSDDYIKDVNLEEEAIKAYYQAHLENFRIPDQINVEYLQFLYPPDSDDIKQNEVLSSAQEILDELQATSDFGKIASRYSLPISESGFFSMEKPNLQLGWSFEVMQKAFQLENNKISGLIETPKGFYILKLKTKKDSHIPDYADVKEKVQKNLASIEAKNIAQKKASEYHKRILEALEKNPKETFIKAVEKLGLEIKQTLLFSRGEYLQNIGIAKEFQEAAFALPDNNAISNVVLIPKGYSILSREDFTPIDEKKFEQEKSAFSDALLVRQKNKVFTDFLLRLKAKAKLQDNISKTTRQK